MPKKWRSLLWAAAYREAAEKLRAGDRPWSSLLLNLIGRGDGRRNQRKVTPLTLDRQVDTGQPGLYRVLVGKPDDYEAQQRWLLLTDLGVVAKKAPGELLVQVSSFRDLAGIDSSFLGRDSGSWQQTRLRRWAIIPSRTKVLSSPYGWRNHGDRQADRAPAQEPS